MSGRGHQAARPDCRPELLFSAGGRPRHHVDPPEAPLEKPSVCQSPKVSRRDSTVEVGGRDDTVAMPCLLRDELKGLGVAHGVPLDRYTRCEGEVAKV